LRIHNMYIISTNNNHLLQHTLYWQLFPFGNVYNETDTSHYIKMQDFN